MATKENKEKERYRKGFNHGYALIEAGIKLPKLDQKKSAVDKSKNEYIKGLKDGTKEFEKERSRQRGVNKVMSGMKKPPAPKSPVRGPKR